MSDEGGASALTPMREMRAAQAPPPLIHTAPAPTREMTVLGCQSSLGVHPAYSRSLPPTDSATRWMILLRISTTWFSVSGFSMLS
jgi:hypothetical protein